MSDLRSHYDLACPRCGQAEKLDVQIFCIAALTIDGTEPLDGHHWDEASFCCCPECGLSGEVGDFINQHPILEHQEPA